MLRYLALCLLMASVVQGDSKFPFEDLVMQNITVFMNRLNSTKISSACQNTLNNLYNDLASAYLFVDAGTIVPTGFTGGNYYDLGHFDQCMNLTVDLNDETIQGRYCLGTLPIPMNGLRNSTRMLGSKLIGLHYAYCFPHTCTTEDANEILSIFDFYDRYCYSKADTRDYDASDITAIVIFSIFGLLALLSTSYDLYLYYNEKKPINDILTAFSLWSNGRKILKTSSGGEQMSSINGIKALSMVWVIYGHVNSNIFQSVGTDNFVALNEFMADAKNAYMLAAPVSVDTFFTVGGILLVYVFLKSQDKGARFNVLMFYLHRYLRLTPALAAIVLFNATLVRYMGNGPFWGTVEETIEPCRSYWWSTLLYIQNYVNPRNMCSGQSWYLSVDMQLYVFSPVVLILIQKSRKLGLGALGLLVLAGIIVPFTVSYTKELNAAMGGGEMADTYDYMVYYYCATYARFGPYVIGMLCGWLIYYLKSNKEFTDSKLRNNKPLILLLWLVCIGGLLACTYGGADVLTGKISDNLSKSLYNALNRNGWSVAVCICITLCCVECGGPINAFLSLELFQLLARLSYSMYLVHFTWVISVRLMSQKTLVHFNVANVVHAFWGDFMITMAVAFIISCVFESPMIIIEKKLFGRWDTKPQPQTKGKV